MKRCKCIVYSIQHTGTRFTKKFFELHGTPIPHRHLDEEHRQPEWRRVIPVRNPIDTWKSWVSRRRDKFTDLEFVSMWAKFIWRTEHQDAFYFPMDVDQYRRQWMLKESIEFIGEEPNMDFIILFAKGWEPLRPSLKPEDRAKIEIPIDVERALLFATEWYNHYTVNYGAHIRNSLDRIGEQP